MTTNQMKCLVALYRSGSFTKASKSLFMTQPAISKNINALEEEIGLTLVERKKGGKIQFTSAGEAYYQSFLSVLNNLEETDFRIKYILPDKKRIFKIGTMETWFLPDLIKLCNKGLPEEMGNIEFQFEFSSPAVINLLMENEQLDFVFTIEPAYQQHTNYVKEHITDIYSSLYTFVDNPAVEDGTIDIEKLDPVLYMISDQLLTHINMKKIIELFSPHKPLIKEVLSGHSAYMNILSGTGSAISDTWSFNHFSSRVVSMPLKQLPIPVIFARKSVSDPFNNQVGDYLVTRINEWIADTPKSTVVPGYNL